jgi:leucyl aminopeptidase
MTAPAPLTYAATDLTGLADLEGRIVLLVEPDGRMDAGVRRVSRMIRGGVARFTESPAFRRMDEGDAHDLAWPAGLKAEAVQVVKLGRRADAETARRAGVAIGAAARGLPVTVLAGGLRRPGELALGILLRGYDYAEMKTPGTGDDAPKAPGAVTVMVADPAAARDAGDLAAMAAGVFLTRDLVNAPANVLTTTAFADRLSALSAHGLEVEVLDEGALADLGMRTLLAVGQGSASPSKVVVMRWQGGGDAAPLALIGKGVVFDTGGISIKPAAGMEDMTMDMGGAGTVAGTMLSLALRGARANVVGVVGLVENMPGPDATRPGDVVKSMKGDTVEIINTDAEGRLVLCDVMWYAQERFTGAIIIGLGHENAGVFSNDDAFCDAFLAAARAEGEGAWRMPLGRAYAKQLKSRIADVKNVGGRPAGSITAAEFLHRFVKDGTPWIHLDIAGVASTSADSPFAPKGATGWGVRALDRLVRDTLEV